MRRLPSLLLLAALACLQAQQSNVTNAARVENWKADLHFLTDTLRGTPIPGVENKPGQKDFSKLYPHWNADVAQLESEMPNLRNGAIAWRIARMYSSAHIAHNLLLPGEPEVIPLGIDWLTEGPVITGATQEFRSAIGARLLKIGDLSPAAFMDALTPYLAYETNGWRDILAGNAMRNRALLELLQLVQDGKVRMTWDAGKGSENVAVPFVSSQARLVLLREALGLPVRFANSHPQEAYYWREYLADSQTLYIQYRQCADDPKLKFTEFTVQTLAEIDRTKPQRVIVDLRFNMGGNDRVIQPLLAGLASRRAIIGSPFGLIGPQTFSSGVRAANDLRRKTKARLMGTPTGGLLGGYGESPSRKLPHSQLGFQWTIKYFSSPEPVSPDIAIAPTRADLLAGRDPVLEAAIQAPR